MLISDPIQIGNKLYKIRKSAGLTQAELAEAAGLADRTYADIERGTTNMRIETLIKICNALNITPNEIFNDEASAIDYETEIVTLLKRCTEKEKKTILKLICVYLDSIK